jgi:glyoxylase-like metal-dependent hydrolase (beta-lactamase superfamily II)
MHKLVRSIAAGCAAGFAGMVWVSMPSEAQQSREEGELAVTAVRGGIYYLVMPTAGNLAVSVGVDGALVIDDQFAPMVPRIQAAVARLTDQPVRYVFNTHWHNDHAGGNEGFGKAGATLVAHDNVRVRMGSAQESRFFKVRVPPSPPVALPAITFSKSLTFHFNGDTVRVEHIPNAHTDGDAIYYFEQADVLHAGDVCVLYGYPFIDLDSGGSIAGMVAGLDRILQIAGPGTVVIPGHGPLADRARVQQLRDRLAEARSRVQKLIAQGKTLEEVIAAKPLADYDVEWGKSFIKNDQFVATIYRSETGA